MTFTVGSALSFGWETFKKRPWLFVLATIIVALVELVIEFVAGVIGGIFAVSDEELPIAFLKAYLPLSAVFGTLATMGWLAFFLAAHDNPETVKLSALWHPRPFWKFFGTSILLLVVMLAGFALALLLMTLSLPLGVIVLLAAIVAFVIVVPMFMFAVVLVIDRGLGPIEAMRESNRITQGHKGRLFCLVLVFMLIGPLYQWLNEALGTPTPINMLQAVAIVAALLALSPVAALANMRAYRILSGTAGVQPADAALAA